VGEETSVRIRHGRCSARRLCAASVLAAMAFVGQPAVAGAVPPPPPNPSDDDVHSGQQHVDATASRVGQLANQVAEADAALLALQSDVELKREDTNKALMDLRAAQEAAAAAKTAAANSRQEADGANAHVSDAQRKIDRFAAGSFRQGSTVGSVTAFLGSRNPTDLLARAELLDSVSGSQLRVLDNMQRARTQSANRDAKARAALAAARTAQQQAVEAKHTADTAYQAAVEAQRAQAGRAAALQARKSGLERQLYAAQNAVAGLQGQRQRFEDWVVQRDREQTAAEQERSVPAPGSAPDTQAGGGSDWGGSSSPAAGTVIDRARSQLGVSYSWGGGDADGPTLGIHDGGIGDSFGDFGRSGFDCSGLMIYAFAPVLGYSLPHYSGSQYNAGRKVPLAEKQPGDMLFWGTNGQIHHVALYIGDGQMIEAPYSGSAVRVAPVRYSGIMPYAARVL
jgi:cell wall-associated NlpC family hydrolase